MLAQLAHGIDGSVMTKFDRATLTSTHWGTYEVEMKEGRVSALKSFSQDPDPSPIGPPIVDLLEHPLRVTAPMIRKSWLEGGPGTDNRLRGRDSFVAVSWDEAETLLAGEIDRIRTEFGNQAIYAGSYGWSSAGRFHHAQSQLKRFLNCAGGFTGSVNTYSFAAAEAMIPHVLGDFRGHLGRVTSWNSIAKSGELFVAFGGAPVKNGQIEAGGIGRHEQRAGMHMALEAGVKCVNVSPLKSDMLDDLGAEWLPIRPNTDVAMMLGIAHVLRDEGLVDHAFLERYCTGYGQFERYLTGADDGQPKTPAWAAAICEIPADQISDLARRMAAKRTMISVSWSLTRQDHGEQPFWMAITLASMLGQIGLDGGGFGFGYSAENSIGAQHAVLRGGSLPQGSNPVADFIPVARVTDLLTRPGETFDYDGQKLTYPDIQMVWWAGGNPFHHHQDLNRFIKAWEKPATIVSNDWCWNSLARRSDIVLPCTTHLERHDLALALRDPYIVTMDRAAEAPGLARDDFEIFKGLADKLGTKESFTEGREADEWVRWIYDVSRQRLAEDGIETPPWDELQEMGWFKTHVPEKPLVMLADFRADPEANPLATPSGKIELFSQVVSDFGYDDCPGHSVWREPGEWLGAVGQYPLHLLSNQPTTKLHSQLDHGSLSQGARINGREPVTLNRADAAVRGIADGDILRLYNDRGACLGAAIVSDDIRPGVVQMSTGAWWDPDEDGMCRVGNPNALCRDHGTSSLAQGPTAHTCLVEIEKFEGELPEITAYTPPEIISSAS